MTDARPQPDAVIVAEDARQVRAVGGAERVTLYGRLSGVYAQWRAGKVECEAVYFGTQPQQPSEAEHWRSMWRAANADLSRLCHAIDAGDMDTLRAYVDEHRVETCAPQQEPPCE